MKGAVGLRCRCFFSTLPTVRIPSAEILIASSTCLTVSSSVKENCSVFFPLYLDKRALKKSSLCSAMAAIVQYSLGLNAEICSSRSTIRRSAGLWTRPADSFGAIFSHIKGDK